MQLAKVVGQAVSTMKHTSLIGQRLVLVQCLLVNGKPDGDPVLALDQIGAGSGDVVIVCSDGAEARKMANSRQSPARWFILGICDP